MVGNKKAKGWRKQTTKKIAGKSVTLGDFWLWLIFYQEASARQEALWDINVAKMGKLHDALNGFERKLSGKLHEVAMDAIRRQRQPFRHSSGLFDPFLTGNGSDKLLAVEGMTGSEVDHNKVAQAFEEDIQKRSNAFMVNKSTHRSSIMNRSRIFYRPGSKRPSNTASIQSGELVPLDNPLFSKLVTYSQILERKDGSRWVPSIAVATIDKWFHLFDAPGSNIDELPEDAFSSLQSITRSGPGGVTPYPSISFNIPRCKFSDLDVTTKSVHIMEEITDVKATKEYEFASIKFPGEAAYRSWMGVLGIASGSFDPDDLSDDDDEDPSTNAAYWAQKYGSSLINEEGQLDTSQEVPPLSASDCESVTSC